MVEPAQAEDVSEEEEISLADVPFQARPRLIDPTKDFKLDSRLKDAAKKRLHDPNLHPLIFQICCGEIVKEKHIERLERAG
jgi:hypothetical protein